jgi:hypothetical protein
MVWTFERRPFGSRIIFIVDIKVVVDLEAGEIQRAADCARTADGGGCHSLGVHGRRWAGVTAHITVDAIVAVGTATADGRVSN